MVNKNKCPYIYEKGNNIGKMCGKDCKFEYCYRHSQNKNTQSKGKEKADENSIITSVESEEIKERLASFEHKDDMHSNSGNISNFDNDEILLSKYFVYDCIRDFFREHKEIEDVLGSKKSSGGNLTTIMGIAGMSLLPILLKNLSGNIIDNALHNKEISTGICTDKGIPSNQPTQGTYTTIEREDKRETTTENVSTSNRSYHTTPETYLESIKGPRI